MEGIRASYESHTSPVSPGAQQSQQSATPAPRHHEQEHAEPPMYSQLVSFPLPQTLSPYAASEAMVESGFNRHRQRLDRTIFKGFFGGILISYGLLAQAAVGGNSSQFLSLAPGLARFFESLVYPIGYALVYFLGMELLTWNAVTFALAGIRAEIPFWSWPVNFFILFWSNLVGALFAAGIFAKFGGISNTAEMSSWFTERANFLGHSPWHNIFLRSIYSEFLVGFALFFAAASSSFLSKLAGLWLALSTLALLQLSTLVTDMFFYPYAIILNVPNISTAYYIGHILMPELIGTIIGALLFVGTLHYSYLSNDEPVPMSSTTFDERHHPHGRPHARSDAEAGTATNDDATGRTMFPRLSMKKQRPTSAATATATEQQPMTAQHHPVPLTSTAPPGA